jgi:hypothetical protein
MRYGNKIDPRGSSYSIYDLLLDSHLRHGEPWVNAADEICNYADSSKTLRIAGIVGLARRSIILRD